MTTPRIEEMVEGLLDRSNCPPSCDGHGTYCEMDSDGDPAPAQCQWCYENVMPQREQLLKALTQVRQETLDEAVEKRPDEPTWWVSAPMTQKEAEIYVQGMYDLMMMVGCDSHCKHYDPLFFEGDTAHSYVLELDDGGRHHSYVTPQWVALKALLEFAQTLKDEWEIGGWNEYFAENTRKSIKEIEALQDDK